MKYTIKQLTDDKEILSHLFLNCVPRNILEEIAEKAGNWEENKYSIDVEVKIDGNKINPKAFFDEFYNQYENMLKKEAQKMITEQLTNKFIEIQNKLQDFSEITESWTQEINWQIANPFIKQ